MPVFWELLYRNSLPYRHHRPMHFGSLSLRNQWGIGSVVPCWSRPLLIFSGAPMHCNTLWTLPRWHCAIVLLVVDAINACDVLVSQGFLKTHLHGSTCTKHNTVQERWLTLCSSNWPLPAPCVNRPFNHHHYHHHWTMGDWSSHSTLCIVLEVKGPSGPRLHPFWPSGAQATRLTQVTEKSSKIR